LKIVALVVADTTFHDHQRVFYVNQLWQTTLA